jgi:hypothetical protein
MDQKPTIGRIVWYQAHGSPNGEHKSEPRAAVVAAAPESETSDGVQRISLCVLTPTGLFFNPLTPYDPNGGPGTWRWPPRIATS